MDEFHVDLLIIGGGINGAGVAADAAGRGLSVLLCEKDDLANHTSSASSKLIHGGLRYLEQYDFKLVRHALKEREILMNMAPHLVHPLSFVLPHDQHLRPKWMIRAGLFLYDHLASRKTLASSKQLKLPKVVEGAPLKDKFTFGFRYSDCYTDDARLVVTNALSAKANGATILTRTECKKLARVGSHWQAELLDKNTRKKIKVDAKGVVNATGAWVSKVLNAIAGENSNAGVKLVKGSHFVVPKFYEGDHAYILQNPDDRIVFVIPYWNDYALIGTTDVSYNGSPNTLKISKDEISYLLKTVNTYFKKQMKADDICWSYAGARALYDDKSPNPSKISRDYHLELDDREQSLPILSVFGGKITTFRTLAEDVLDKLKPYYPQMKSSWTASSQLPGGDLGGKSYQEFCEDLKRVYAKLPSAMLNRMAYHYGSNVFKVLGYAQSTEDLGDCVAGDLFQKEEEYLRNNEWAQSMEDILWRRTKVGLICPRSI